MRRTWEMAGQTIDGLSGVSVSHFKPHFAMILAYETDKGRSENMEALALQQENARLAEMIRDMRAELDALRPDPDTSEGKIRAAGWTPARSGRYYLKKHNNRRQADTNSDRF